MLTVQHPARGANPVLFRVFPAGFGAALALGGLSGEAEASGFIRKRPEKELAKMLHIANTLSKCARVGG